MAENYFGVTDTGKQRDNNEDTFIAETVLNDRFIMACVIDGVGGYDGGEVAAAIARQSILEYFTVLSGDVRTMLKEAVTVANKKIYAERQLSKQNGSMACVLTVALVDIENKEFYYAHVGDTRLYLLRDASLVKVTKDHSFVGFLEDTGRLTEEKAMTHPKRNEINKALGFDAQIGNSADYIDTGTSPFLPGDMLLLCSDGLTDMVDSKQIISLLTTSKTLEEKGRELIAAANNNGGKDNITVVLVYNDAVPLKQKATKPKPVKKKDYQKSEESVAEAEQILPIEKEVHPQKRGKGLVAVLSILCLLLAATVLWLWFHQTEKDTAVVTPVVKKDRHEGEKKLLDTINRMTGDTLMLSDSLFTQPFLLSDTLLIQRDSLLLQGRENFTISCDTSFKGPAFALSTDTKYISLENITFENFDVGILADHPAVHLKNVRFKNCRLSVQYGFTFPDSVYVNGFITDSSFLKTDSIPK